ncbi:MAG TPA: hypothetical protein VHU90_02450 [Galbitalea sp.]|jgi:hypothetical protein|nr:hypothetical protein [Galbitalea sp.]
MAEKLASKGWVDFATLELEDVPRFEYKAREGEYIEFSDASAGQQATALMFVLLNQDGPPLIIDQPEDESRQPRHQGHRRAVVDRQVQAAAHLLQSQREPRGQW